MSQLLELMNQHVAAIRELKVSEFDDETLRLLALDTLTAAKGFGAGDERENAARICNAAGLEARRAITPSTVERVVQYRRGALDMANDLNERIKSGERAAPVDGVADEPKVGEWRCNTCGKSLGTAFQPEICPDHPTGTVHKFQPTSDPAAAVTADGWLLTDAETPNKGEWTEVTEVIGAKPLVRKWNGQIWNYGEDDEAPGHHWKFWRRITPTAPPVANQWRKSAVEMPQVGKMVKVRGTVREHEDECERKWTGRRWTNGVVISPPDPTYWPEWRFIESASASDTVEGDDDPRDRAYWQAAYIDLERVNIKTEAERDEAVKARIEMHTAMNGMQDMWRACEERLIVAEEDRDRHAADMGRMRLEIIGLENERGSLRTVCAEYERTVTGLRQDRERLTEVLVDLRREIDNQLPKPDRRQN